MEAIFWAATQDGEGRLEDSLISAKAHKLRKWNIHHLLLERKKPHLFISSTRWGWYDLHDKKLRPWRNLQNILWEFLFISSSIYLRDVPSFFRMAPACDETLGPNAKVTLRQAHRPHASIVSERRLELNKSQVLVLVLMRNVARMLDDFFDWNVLLISLFSVKIMIPCSESTETVENFLRNLCTPNRWMLLCNVSSLQTKNEPMIMINIKEKDC